MAKNKRFLLRLWCGCFLAVVLISAACIRWIDYPVAALFLKPSKHVAAVGGLFSGEHIVAGEFLVIAVLALAHFWGGGLPKPANALLAACCASIMAYTLNNTVLKVLFGRSNPLFFYQAHADKFLLFRGDEHSSFPSGHMMLASAFLAVFFYAYPRTRILIALLMALGCLVLVLGDWHFVSDVVAGAFLGFTAGLVTAAVWSKGISTALAEAAGPERQP